MWGITKVFEDYDAVIVLEDDCVTSPNFINYMYQCIEKYRLNKDVWQINGYMSPIKMSVKHEYDVFFVGRNSSTGWGTWRDRWAYYNKDNKILSRLQNNYEKSIRLAQWGQNLPRMFDDRLNGRNDSWAIYWSLIILEHGGQCVQSYESHINNIGFDGSGTHSGVSSRYDVIVEKSPVKKYKLPNQITTPEDVRKANIVFWGNATMSTNNNELEHVFVYGLGNVFLRYEKIINESFFIEGVIDVSKVGYFAGRRIIKPEEIELYKKKKVLITIADSDERLVIKRNLISLGVRPENIIIAKDCLIFE